MTAESGRSWKNEPVLITGGLGFIGSNLARRLVLEGARVTVVDCLRPEYGGNLFNVDGIREQMTMHVLDLRETEAVRRLVQAQNYRFSIWPDRRLISIQCMIPKPIWR